MAFANDTKFAFEIQITQQSLKKTIERQENNIADNIVGCWLFVYDFNDTTISIMFDKNKYFLSFIIDKNILLSSIIFDKMGNLYFLNQPLNVMGHLFHPIYCSRIVLKNKKKSLLLRKICVHEHPFGRHHHFQ